MKESIKKRIEAVRRGEVPEGYKRTDLGVMPEEWSDSTIGKVIAFHSEKSTINNEYHDFGENKKLRNKIHPDRPKNSSWECPCCTIFD